MAAYDRIFHLLSPERRLQIQKQEREAEVRSFNHLMKTQTPQVWDDTKTKFADVLLLDAKSWNPVQLFPVKPMRGLPGERISQLDRKECVAACGRFLYVNHILPKTYPLKIAQGKTRRGVVYFSADVTHPCLCEQRRPNEVPRVLMGLTPMEIFTQRQGLRLACGRVVVGGLGLGWFLNEVAKKPSVTEVVVVEKEQSLLDWLKPVLLEKYPALAKVKAWVCDDVWHFMETDTVAHPGTKYLLDIWPSYNNWDFRYDQWQRKLKPNQLWGWGIFSD